MSEKLHLIENFAKDWNNNVLPLIEHSKPTNKIVEAEGKTYEAISFYEVPVWRLDEENLNGRTYKTQLGEKIVKENKKTFSLKDHPEDSGSVDRIVGVAENPRIKEGILYADVYIVDEAFETKLEKIISRGIGLGVSSSGYGEIDDNKDIITESYELERYFDFVLDPSYQVYLTKESIKTKEVIKEVVIDNNKKETKDREPIMESKNKKLTIEEKNLRLGVKQLFKTVDESASLKEKVYAYNEILEYCDGMEDIASVYITQANEGIEKVNEEIYALADKATEVDALKEEVKTTNETSKKEKLDVQKNLDLIEKKYDKAQEMLDDIKLREKKITEMYKIAVAEKNTMASAKEYKELLVYSETQENEVSRLRKELIILKKENLKLVPESVVIEAEDKKKSDKKDDKDMYNKDKKDDKDSKKEELIVKEVPNNFKADSVQYYYEDLKFANPKIVNIKSEIMKCRTVFEAQKTYLNLRDLVEDYISPIKVPSIKEETVEGRKEAIASYNSSTLKIRKGWD